jgi:autoinducer 2-degrading protein
MFVVTVSFQIKAPYATTFLDRVRQQAADTLNNEKQCRRFDVCVAADDSSKIFLYEIYDDAPAFANHLQTPHFLSFNSDTQDWVEIKTVEQWVIQ